MGSWRFSVILMAIALSCIGLWLSPRLQFNFSPSQRNKSLSISYTYPDASAEVVERRVAVYIEGGLSRIKGVDRIYSEIGLSSGSTRVDIDKDADLDHLRFEVAQFIRQLYPSLPEEVSYPSIILNDPEDKVLDPTLLSYSFSGALSRTDLFEYARDVLVPHLATVEGVYEVRLQGVQDLEWKITYDEDQLKNLGVSIYVLQQYLRSFLHGEGLSYAGDGSHLKYISIYPNSIQSLLDQKLPSDSIRGGIPLTQIIDIEASEARIQTYYRINGKNSITLNFVPKSDANHLRTAAAIHQAVGDLLPTLPATCQLNLSFDTTQYIAKELAKIRDRTVWSLAILLFFIIITYRKLSRIILLIFCLVTNLGIASIFYYLLDVQLNLYALAGVTVSFGLIIDNIIVVAHHYQHERNLSVAPALMTASMTTLVALMVIFFLPEQLQWELEDFAKVIGINLVVSLMVSLLLVPAVIDRYGGSETTAVQTTRYKRRIIQINMFYKNILMWIRRYRRLVILSLVLLFGIPVFWLPQKVEGWTLYNKTLGNDYYLEEIRPWVNKALGGTLRLFAFYVYEGSSYRSPQETKLYVNAAMPQGTTIEQMDDLIRHIEQYLDKYKNQLNTFVTRVSSGQTAHIRITFKDGINSSFPYILKNRLQSAAIDLGGVTWNIYGVGKGFSNAGGSSPPSFNVLMKGYNKEILAGYAEEFAALLLKHPRIQKVDTDANIRWWEKDQYQYEIDMNMRDLAHRDWSIESFYAMLRSYEVRDPLIGYTQDHRAIRTHNRDEDGKNLWVLQHQQERWQGKSILLGQISSISKKKLSNKIHKENQQYLRRLQFEYTGSGRFGSKYLNECLDIYIPQLPLGYSIERDKYGRYFWKQKQKKQYGLLGIVIVAIFFLSTIHFESFKSAMLIICLIPTSYIGIFLTFYWFDFPFDQGGYTSFLLLTGLVVNSLILILSDYSRNKRMHPNRRHFDMYLRAFRGKITPVALTIVSTALGLLPFTMQGSQEVFWFSLAVGTIGGLLFSLIVLIVFIPVIVSKQ